MIETRIIPGLFLSPCEVLKKTSRRRKMMKIAEEVRRETQGQKTYTESDLMAELKTFKRQGLIIPEKGSVGMMITIGSEPSALVITAKENKYEINFSQTDFDGICPSYIVRLPIKSDQRDVLLKGIIRGDTFEEMGAEREYPDSVRIILVNLKWFQKLHKEKLVQPEYWDQ